MSEGNLHDLFLSGGEMPEVAETPPVEERRLGDHKPGNIVKIGDIEFIVLEHYEGDSTAVITKDIVCKMRYGKNGDYVNSEVRKWLNEDFYKQLTDVVGESNIKTHIVDLTADDGTGKNITVTDYVSLLTTQRYRMYRQLLKPLRKWWWTATRANADDRDYARIICRVHSSGILDWSGIEDARGGVRPFCLLNSSIFVD